MRIIRKNLFITLAALLVMTGCAEGSPESSAKTSSDTAIEETAAVSEPTTEEQTENITETQPETTAETTHETAVLEFRMGIDPDTEPFLTNENIVSAYSSYVHDGQDFDWNVIIEFDDTGTDIFADVTEQVAGTDTPVSIWYCGELISAPLVGKAISNGKVAISGNFNEESATELADKLDPDGTKRRRK